MTETKDKEAGTGDGAKKTLSLGGKGTLSLKGGLGTKIRPSGPASSGAATVEVRRTRRTGSQVSSTSAAATGSTEETLTSQEREARAKALQKALEQGGRRTTLPKRQPTQIKQEEPAEEEKTLSADDARAQELEEMRRIEEVEKSRSRGKPAYGTGGGPAAGFAKP
ncbi:MAG: hypothetical protein LRZ85_07490 [Alphaproteobacteria bacterium]|nr:hypothetical protein [Alphaproteobacteria bacterium]